MTQKYLDELTFNVIGAAIEVHRNILILFYLLESEQNVRN